ncbi:hypothetical protein H4219_003401 [Mycoemilia scoparia]|uniref:Uncharacterized protein n=1 Tax=Mycoemilia scoparia TaxID=417184 RepID=A0A9W7ZVP0_9FUNG|nr:hypothetical protein H4219_003401 [Mycoemilia scoparia]
MESNYDNFNFSFNSSSYYTTLSSPHHYHQEEEEKEVSSKSSNFQLRPFDVEQHTTTATTNNNTDTVVMRTKRNNNNTNNKAEEQEEKEKDGHFSTKRPITLDINPATVVSSNDNFQESIFMLTDDGDNNNNNSPRAFARNFSNVQQQQQQQQKSYESMIPADTCSGGDGDGGLLRFLHHKNTNNNNSNNVFRGSRGGRIVDNNDDAIIKTTDSRDGSNNPTDTKCLGGKNLIANGIQSGGGGGSEIHDFVGINQQQRQLLRCVEDNPNCFGSYSHEERGIAKASKPSHHFITNNNNNKSNGISEPSSSPIISINDELSFSSFAGRGELNTDEYTDNLSSSGGYGGHNQYSTTSGNVAEYLDQKRDSSSNLVITKHHHQQQNINTTTTTSSSSTSSSSSSSPNNKNNNNCSSGDYKNNNDSPLSPGDNNSSSNDNSGGGGSSSSSSSSSHDEPPEYNSILESYPPIKPLQMFQFADTLDKFMIIIGTIASIIVGGANPLLLLIFGKAMGYFIAYQAAVNITNGGNPNKKASSPPPSSSSSGGGGGGGEGMLLIESRNNLDMHVRKCCWYFLAIGLGIWIAGFVMSLCWNIASERQIRRIRSRYYQSILRQPIGWFDQVRTGDLTNRISGDIGLLKEGIGERVGFVLQLAATFISGIGIAFTNAWKVSLVICAVLPLVIGSAAVMSILLSRWAAKGQDQYAGAGAIATEVLSNIKTVMSFNSQERELQRYNRELSKAYLAGKKKGITSAICTGLMMFFVFSGYCVGFWFGSTRILAGEYMPDQVLTAFFTLMFGGVSLGSAAPNISSIATGRGCASRVYGIISQKSPIDAVHDEEGISAKSIEGSIEFRNIDFSYPIRPDVPILRNFGLAIKPGEKVALVGGSGCGKSTTVGLVERFYDPDGGQVLIDGIDIKEYNVRSLRQQLGMVTQEPVLFSTTIYQNIVWGAINPENEPPTKEQVIDAAKAANAHAFISRLPDGYDTVVGEGGALLSGGQKQRIAIARALIRNPKILLLDEATSALDTESERLVQDALDKLSKSRTTITIAHRLSTIRSADRIYVIREGQVLESGTHDELVKQDGEYAAMVKAQELRRMANEKVTGEYSDEEADIQRLVDEELDRSKRAGGEGGTTAGPNRSRKLGLFGSSRDNMLKGNSGADSVGDGLKRAMSVEKLQNVLKFNKELSLSSNKYYTQVEEDSEEATNSSGLINNNNHHHHQQDHQRGGLGLLLRLFWEYRHGIFHRYFIGAIGAIVEGSTLPLFSIVFSKLVVVFSIQDHDQFQQQSLFYSLLFLVFGGSEFIGMFMRVGFFSIGSEKLTQKIRHDTFRALLRQEAGFYDHEGNGTGSLAAKLATEAECINKFGSVVWSMLTSSLASVAAGVSISFIVDWRMSLVAVGCLPFIILSQYVLARNLEGSSKRELGMHKEAGQTASETIANIKTVASLTREHTFIQIFDRYGSDENPASSPPIYFSAFAYGFSNACILFIYALLLFVGSRFVIENTLAVQGLFQIMFAVIFSSFAVAMLSQQASTYTDGVNAAVSIYELLDRKPKIDGTDDGINGALPDSYNGKARLRNVNFSYPIRPKAQILQNVSFEAKPGQTIALVGGSGSGKSTTIALLQRLYDVNNPSSTAAAAVRNGSRISSKAELSDINFSSYSSDGINDSGGSDDSNNHTTNGEGGVFVEDIDVRDWNIRSLRDNMSVVSQEPVLFGLSIAENIAYGKPNATMQEIEDAARNANIYDFISNLPDGFDTNAGQKGGQLSGGQKQRIAIARAMIRNPKLLLLDEATSALDSSSEKAVQAVLDKVKLGRTTITIAHRLSTIQDSDVIVVFQRGQVVETGTHDELLQKNGVYAGLVKQQSLEVTH